MRHVIILRGDCTRRTVNRTSDWVEPMAGMFQTTVCGPYLAPIDFHPLDPLNHVVGKLLASYRMRRGTSRGATVGRMLFNLMLPMCRVYVEVRIKFSTSQCFFLTLLCCNFQVAFSTEGVRLDL